jgi:hypothetical protein
VPEAGDVGAVACAGRLQENSGPDSYDGSADAENGSRVCDDLEVALEIQMEVRLQSPSLSPTL